MEHHQFYVLMLRFKFTIVEVWSDYMGMTEPSTLVLMHTSNGMLPIVCFNDAFQIFARGFFRRVHGHDITPVLVFVLMSNEI